MNELVALADVNPHQDSLASQFLHLLVVLRDGMKMAGQADTC